MDELEHHFADVEIGGENRHENLSPMHGQFDEQVENSDENSVEGEGSEAYPLVFKSIHWRSNRRRSDGC